MGRYKITWIEPSKQYVGFVELEKYISAKNLQEAEKEAEKITGKKDFSICIDITGKNK